MRKSSWASRLVTRLVVEAYLVVADAGSQRDRELVRRLVVQQVGEVAAQRVAEPQAVGGRRSTASARATGSASVSASSSTR